MKDHYKTLGLNHSATPEDIKKAYRKLALRYHPDTNPNYTADIAKFRAITEAYEILSDVRLKADFDNTYADNQGPHTKQKTSVSPADILKLFTETRLRVVKLGRENINETGLFTSLDDLLSDEVVAFLQFHDQSKTNRAIMNEVLICTKYLQYHLAEKLILKLVKLAAADAEAILLIHKFDKKQKRWSKWVEFKRYLYGFAVIALITLVFVTNDISESATIRENRVVNRELDSDFNINTETPEQTEEQKLENAKQDLINQGFEEQNIQNGQFPSCYNFKPKKGKINNYLQVNVGSGSDVSVKIMNVDNSSCVRYVYIKSGTSYKIKNIPPGIYYLKIAYGKNWFSKVENSQCIGKFLRNSFYEKGEDVLDFNLKYNSEGYSIPSFKLDLDVISSQTANSFNSQDISEDEFNL